MHALYSDSTRIAGARTSGTSVGYRGTGRPICKRTR